MKNGFMEGQQRYKCKECNYNFVNKPRRGYGIPKMAFVVWLYLNGLSQRKIADLIGVSSVAISKWVKEFNIAKKPGLLRRTGIASVIDPNDIEVYIKGEKLKPDGGRIVVVLEDNTLPKNSVIIINTNEEQSVDPEAEG
ncbi:MAG: helix-turn-helix domain-containing protein [Alphaproteobacteria bacterium]|nr:helix-turn-helix domain-containing protein [Alphaproteobacteria bacterium]